MSTPDNADAPKKGEEKPKQEEKPKPQPEKPPGPVKRWVTKTIHNRVFQVAAAICVAAFLLIVFFHAYTHEDTDDAYTAGHIHNIAPRVAGTVLEVRVDDNQLVKQGDILVVLDPADYQVQVDQARAEFKKAKADYDRLKPLRGDEAISQQDYDDAESAYKVAEAKLQDAENQLSYCVIRAPSDGRVGRKSVEVGNRVTVGGALMAVVEDVWVVANLKETQLGKIRRGQEVDVEIDILPGKKFKGVVDSWSPGTGSTFALLPSDNATGNFTKIVQRVPVKIRFVADSIRGYEDLIVPGLSCVPTIALRTTPKDEKGVARNLGSESTPPPAPSAVPDAK
ncbi:MAG TPA: HlyD family secretion protein [Candidatus Methylacidiphilales bacterium]